MKLEIKHLAPYLPYNLRFDNGRDYEKDYLYGMRANCYNVKMAQGARDSDYFRLEKIKPVLRPISDLTKEIEHNGEKFVPIDKLKLDGISIRINDFGLMVFFDEDYEWVYFKDIVDNIYQKLLSWHFDIFSLIQNGLAIDINKIKL